MNRQIQLDLNYLKAFERLDSIKSGIVIMIGGRGSGKSISVSKWVLDRLLNKENARGILIRDEAVLIKNSILNDIKQIANEFDNASQGYFSKLYNIQENKIKNLKTNEDAVFTIGMRTSSGEQKAKLKSLSSLDFAIIEEAEDVKDENAVRRLLDTLVRFKDAVIFFILNTPEKNHWIVKRFFDLKKANYEGFYELIPKELENTHIFVSNYKDNDRLIKEAVRQYESYGDPNSANYDPAWYCNQILGLVPELGLQTAICKRTHKTSWRDSDDIAYTINHSWIQSQIYTQEGFFFLAFDGGVSTTHSAAVFGYHIEKFNRDIIIKEFFNKLKSEDVVSIALECESFLIQNKVPLDNLKLYGDPAMTTTGENERIEGIFNKRMNCLENYRQNENGLLRQLYINRKIKRLNRLSDEIYQIRADNKPSIIVLRDYCENLYKGFFEGEYRWELYEGKPTEKLEQISPITDICDAYTYYLLAERPFSTKIKEESEKKEYNKLYGT